MRYLDSGFGGEGECLGQVLQAELVDGVQAFRAQFGFYGSTAIMPFVPQIRRILDQGGLFHLVVGSNRGDPVTTDDVNALLPVITDNDNARLSIVTHSDLLFHPKTFHLVREDETSLAYVGSANLTEKGLGHNVEAGLLIDSACAPAEVLRLIADAVDRWFEDGINDVHEITSAEDVARLTDLGYLISRETRRRLRRRFGGDRDNAGGGRRGTRPRGWRPPPNPDAAPVAGPADADAADEVLAAEADEIDAGDVEDGGEVEVEYQWCKRLPTSDAQQPSAATRTVNRSRTADTNVTGNLRLTKGGFRIQPNRYFRETFFGDEDWVEVMRGTKNYDQVHIRMRVEQYGADAGEQTFLIDHAAHRADHAGEPTTVLKWGSTVGRWLRNNNQTGNWVVLEKFTDGTYKMSFLRTKPEWA